MKKIVALVLSLVMVLGLATTAFAAATPVALGDKYLMNTTNNETVYGPYALTYVPAVAPTVDEDTGFTTAPGAVAYYYITIGAETFKYVEVATLGEADQVFYNDAEGTVVFKYLKKIDTEVYLGDAVPFNDFGKDCGQFKAIPTAGADYYLFMNGSTGKLEIYVGDTNGSTYLMVGGKRVEVAATPVAGKWVAHTAVYTYDAKFQVTAIKCDDCDAVGVIVPNYASLPEDVIGYGPINTSMWYYWNEAPVAEAPEATDKVESAQTFDAGIAMYVGMSVMAAAGSAVVLKKKD